MKVDGRHFRSIWLKQDGWSVGAIRISGSCRMNS